MPGRQELPSTVERSSEKAQRTWIKAHDSAVDSYSEGERAHRTAYAALKHSYEKVGDHWEAKKSPGPSDKQAAQKAPENRDNPRASQEGVDENSTKEHLYGIAKKLDIPRRSTMSKKELVSAIKKANRQKTAQARQ